MVTNQDGLGTSSFPRPTFEAPQEFILQAFRSQGIEFDAVFVCPHFQTDGCECRKPELRSRAMARRLADARRQLDALDDQIKAVALRRVNALQDQAGAASNRSADLNNQLSSSLSASNCRMM